MDNRIERIARVLTSCEGVTLIGEATERDEKLVFSIGISEQNSYLEFLVEILPLYPMQFHDTETIRFINKDLLKYGHINADGSICVHTLHSTNLEEKIRLDLHSLIEWVRKYYIRREKDAHYEHIVVNEKVIESTRSIFLFTEVDYQFKDGESGYFKYSPLATGFGNEKRIETYLIQSFKTKKRKVICEWSDHYRKRSSIDGLYCFVSMPPVKNERFAVESWKELEPYVSQSFIQLLFSEYQKLLQREEAPIYITILLGYTIANKEIHWQAARLPLKSLPITKNKVLRTEHYLGGLLDQEILWAQTRNCSFKYYFGRGMLHPKLSESKILVIGLGAVGSMVAKSLVRGGIRDITLIDYDLKEAENVCRSEYDFHTGVCNKAVELHSNLLQISPFVHVRHSEVLMDAIKFLSNTQNIDKHFENLLNEYEVIFDCTTDNDVASLLDRLNIKSQVICVSITNGARELVCAVKPNLYAWLSTIFEGFVGNNHQDLYRPNGCCSPTFRAGYTDIALLVQAAIKQINSCYVNGKVVRNFIIRTIEEEGSLQLKTSQY